MDIVLLDVLTTVVILKLFLMAVLHDHSRVRKKNVDHSRVRKKNVLFFFSPKSKKDALRTNKERKTTPFFFLSYFPFVSFQWFVWVYISKTHSSFCFPLVGLVLATYSSCIRLLHFFRRAPQQKKYSRNEGHALHGDSERVGRAIWNWTIDFLMPIEQPSFPFVFYFSFFFVFPLSFFFLCRKC